MITPPIPPDEEARLQALNQLNLLNSDPDPALDRLTRLAARVFGVENALISLVAADFQFFKSCYGFTGKRTARDVSFCGHTIIVDDLLVLEDAREDPRFHDNPSVIGPPHIRFYAGKALKTLSGYRIGSLCVFDSQPRKLDQAGIDQLIDVAMLVQKELHAREFALRASLSQARASEEIIHQEGLFLSTFEQAAVGVAHLSLDGDWLRVNARFANLLGHSVASLMAVPLNELLEPESAAHMIARRERLINGGECERTEEQVQHREGHKVWLELTYSLFRGETGQPWFLVLIAQDISARKAAEAELQALQASLQAEIAARTQQLTSANVQLARALGELRVIQDQTLIKKRRLSDTLDTALEAFVGATQEGTIVEWNQQATETFGWTRDEAMGNNFADLIIMPEHRDAVRAAVRAYVEFADLPQLFERGEMHARHKDGHPIEVEKTVSPIWDNGRYLFNIFLHDISARKHAQAELRENQEQLQTIMDNVPVLIGYVEANLRCRYMNATYEEWFGRDPQLLIDQPIPDVASPEEWALIEGLVRNALSGNKSAADIHLDTGNHPRDVRLSMIPDLAADGHVRGCFTLGVDLSDRKRLEETLRREAMEDPLTGLPNRRAILQLIQRACERQERHPQPLAVFFLDLDGFKAVNDQFGHDAGDEVLTTFGRRLQTCVRKTDSVARLAGDEFTILLEDLQNPKTDATRVAQKIVQAMQQPFDLGEHQITLSTSIGIALHLPGEPVNAEALLSVADAAMYEIKQSTKNGYRFAGPPEASKAGS
ncbi:diguanylate cyclase (GGDEF)-like protein/PAS domain S-box-containing protein [Silvimonas terrae]|uniref:Diguanylate cyclase (GGDEF)-like protein/PAS domain S-box-containing protein n=1 Tax=Silvimonas terrae TaxID=300266 RepID=A0A840RBM4_9NEIS|nr:diguanylate cyclase [Silvimonas terrae]MBB5190327.1 diguanylate cyclase (GGDEF)-like protein/PAS domain S-box-containing protein [Silvimonas terrae]